MKVAEKPHVEKTQEQHQQLIDIGDKQQESHPFLLAEVVMLDTKLPGTAIWNKIRHRLDGQQIEKLEGRVKNQKNWILQHRHPLELTVVHLCPAAYQAV